MMIDLDAIEKRSSNSVTILGPVSLSAAELICLTPAERDALCKIVRAADAVRALAVPMVEGTAPGWTSHVIPGEVMDALLAALAGEEKP